MYSTVPAVGIAFRACISACTLLCSIFGLGGCFNPLLAQNGGCSFKDPIVQIDFGSATKTYVHSLAGSNKYRLTNSSCPHDGQVAIVAKTSGCFWGNWITLDQDHTPNDIDGNVLLVNAAYEPGLFFQLSLPALEANRRYEFSVWMTNVCRAGNNCDPVPPAFSFIIANSQQQIVNLVTSPLQPTGVTNWVRYSGFFTAPANGLPLQLHMFNKIHGGCGNDFAMDDLMIRECVTYVPPASVAAKPTVVTPKKNLAAKPVQKKQVPQKTPAKVTRVNGAPVKLMDSPRAAKPVRLITALPNPPAVITSRANPVVRQIQIPEGQIQVDLYDNGEIDGDTVSIYHNNKLVLSRAGLSAKPVSFFISINQQQPHHELVMVANNLGSIPPNTSLMIVTAAGKRFEVFISASEQKNAKVLIDLQQ